jgi:hypothetical protein
VPRRPWKGQKGAPSGEVPERLNGTVSKTVVALWATVGSNPTLSAFLFQEFATVGTRKGMLSESHHLSQNRQKSGGFPFLLLLSLIEFLKDYWIITHYGIGCAWKKAHISVLASTAWDVMAGWSFEPGQLWP